MEDDIIICMIVSHSYWKRGTKIGILLLCVISFFLPMLMPGSATGQGAMLIPFSPAILILLIKNQFDWTLTEKAFNSGGSLLLLAWVIGVLIFMGGGAVTGWIIGRIKSK